MRDLLTAGLTALDLDPAAADKLARYAELLLEKNKVMNLTGHHRAPGRSHPGTCWTARRWRRSWTCPASASST